MTRRIEHEGGLARGDGVAAWRQIADRLAREVASGDLAPGQQVPTESALAERFGVNRHTVRRALAALAERGLVRATQGRGTFVEPRPLNYPIGTRTRFSEIVSRNGREPGGAVLARGEVGASPALATALAVPPASRLLRVEMLRSADGVPLSWSISHIPLPRFEGIEALLDEGVSAAFARYGVADYRRATTRITARAADPEVARRLDLAPGRAVLLVESRNEDRACVPIQVTMAWFAADRVEIEVET